MVGAPLLVATSVQIQIHTFGVLFQGVYVMTARVLIPAWVLPSPVILDSLLDFTMPTFLYPYKEDIYITYPAELWRFTEMMNVLGWARCLAQGKLSVNCSSELINDGNEFIFVPLVSLPIVNLTNWLSLSFFLKMASQPSYNTLLS